MASSSQPGPQVSRVARISFLVFVFLFIVSLFFGPTGGRPGFASENATWKLEKTSKSIEERVEHILKHTPLIDGHNDFPIFLRFAYKNHINSPNFTEPFENGTLPFHVDLLRLRKGMVGGAFWSVFWPCPVDGQDYTDQNYLSTVQSTLQQIDLMTRLKAAYPHDFSPSLTSSSAVAAFRHNHALISPLGIEGLHQIGNSAATLRHYHALGVRYATLTHNCGNRFADAALWERPGGGGIFKAPPVWHGVSPAGRRLIGEMNRLGMLVDLSHTSVDTQVDVLGGGEDGWEGSRAPVIYSHSSAYGICPHPRNVQDHVLELVRKKGGVVMVNFSPDFVSCVPAEEDRGDGLPDFFPGNATMEQVARHVVYIGERIGFEHVGIGSDFDGIMATPEGLEDVAAFPRLVGELLRRGVSDEDVKGVVGGNVLRVWGEAERVARELQKGGQQVLEDELDGLGLE